MRRLRLRFTIGQLMTLIAVVGLLLGIEAWAAWNQGLLFSLLFSLSSCLDRSALCCMRSFGRIPHSVTSHQDIKCKIIFTSVITVCPMEQGARNSRDRAEQSPKGGRRHPPTPVSADRRKSLARDLPPQPPTTALLLGRNTPRVLGLHISEYGRLACDFWSRFPTGSEPRPRPIFLPCKFLDLARYLCKRVVKSAPLVTASSTRWGSIIGLRLPTVRLQISPASGMTNAAATTIT